MLLVGFEPEEESPIVFLRLRKAVRKRGLAVTSIAPFATPRPDEDGRHARRDRRRAARPPRSTRWRRRTWHARRTVILVGERLADRPGALLRGGPAGRRAPARGWRGSRAAPVSAAHWKPVRRRTCCPAAGRVADAAARAEVAAAWNVDDTARRARPGHRRRSSRPPPTARCGALLVGGVELDDLPDPAAALAAIDAAPFVVSLELRHSAVTERADVVFPVAPVAEKAGTFVNWEGRPRSVRARAAAPTRRPTCGCWRARRRDRRRPRPARRRRRARRDSHGSAAGRARRPHAPDVARAAARTPPEPGEAVLASWRMLLDAGRLQDGEPTSRRHRAAPGRPAVGADGRRDRRAPTAIRSRCAPTAGAITLPLVITDMPDRVVGCR